MAMPVLQCRLFRCYILLSTLLVNKDIDLRLPRPGMDACCVGPSAADIDGSLQRCRAHCGLDCTVRRSLSRETMKRIPLWLLLLAQNNV